LNEINTLIAHKVDSRFDEVMEELRALRQAANSGPEISESFVKSDE